MPKLNTTVKSVRIDNDKLAELEARLGGRTINSWLNEKIEDYLRPCTAENVEKEGKPSKNSKKSEASPNEDLKEIESMAGFWGITAKELLKGVCSGLMDGNLTYEKGMVVGIPEVDLENLYDVCHERGIEPQEAINKLVLTMRKGK